MKTDVNQVVTLNMLEAFVKKADTKIKKVENKISLPQDSGSSALQIHIGSEPPSDPNMIWFDTSEYEN